MALHALHGLVSYHSVRGEHTEAIHRAGQILALDPWREEAHRQMMLLLAHTGQRGAALAQHEKCRQLLETEGGDAAAIWRLPDAQRRPGARGSNLAPGPGHL